MIIYQNAFRVLCTLLARKVGREINDRQPYSLCVCCTKRVDTVAVSRTWTMKSNQWSVYSGCCRVRGSVAWAITVRCDDLNDAMHLISHTILNATCYWWENVIRYLVFMCLSCHLPVPAPASYVNVWIRCQRQTHLCTVNWLIIYSSKIWLYIWIYVAISIIAFLFFSYISSPFSFFYIFFVLVLLCACHLKCRLDNNKVIVTGLEASHPKKKKKNLK